MKNLLASDVYLTGKS